MLSDAVTICPALVGLSLAGILKAWEINPSIAMIASIGASFITAIAVVIWIKRRRDSRITIQANNFIIK